MYTRTATMVSHTAVINRTLVFLPYTGRDYSRNSLKCTSRQGYNDNLYFEIKDKYKAFNVKP